MKKTERIIFYGWVTITRPDGDKSLVESLRLSKGLAFRLGLTDGQDTAQVKHTSEEVVLSVNPKSVMDQKYANDIIDAVASIGPHITLIDE